MKLYRLMDNLGFYRVRAFSPQVRIADPVYNAVNIIEAVKKAASENVDCLVFPELSLTAYTCADLFFQDLLIKKTESETKKILKETANYNTLFAIGAPIHALGKLYNCAIIICKGEILGIVPKTYLPNYGEFYEKRWFHSGRDIKNETISFTGRQIRFGTDILFQHLGVNIGVEICEDLWVPSPPSDKMVVAGADIILNLSASDDLIGKHDYLLSLVSQQSARCRCIYVYASSGWGESSTDLVFTGKAIISENGNILENNNQFSICPTIITKDVDIQKLRSDRIKYNTFNENANFNNEFHFISSIVPNISYNSDLNYLKVDPLPFVPNETNKLNQRCQEIINIQAYGLMKRLASIGCKKAVVGISGGLDSTLALLVTVRAFDNLKINRKGIIGVTMPGLATTSRTKNNAKQLMDILGVESLEISISKAIAQHFTDIQQNPDLYDATFENSQARERTQILMDLANKEDGIVIGTGDMSELALGWCTYNGDQMSMYGVNASVPKTLVKHLVEWIADNSEQKTADILRDICNTPISPELIPSNEDEISQKTEDLVGPYELHDFFLYNFLRNSFVPIKIYRLAIIAFKDKYEPDIILKWIKVFYKRFFSQQFKRSCMPDGPKVGSVNLSPRGDWRMPSDATVSLWLSSLENL